MMRNTEIDTVDRRKNERGIAVIVVVAIMVALIMITTALLATVTRSTATAKVYIQKDLARIAALSGRAVALDNIKAPAAIAATAKIDVINNGLFYSLASTDDDFRNLKIAYGLVPVAKIRIPGRTYDAGCPVWPAWDTLLSGTGTSGGVQTYWQRPNETHSNYKYIFLSGLDKTLSSSHDDGPPPIPYTESNAFYGTYYAVAIQDLGGCLNVNTNGVNNDYNKTVLENILKETRTVVADQFNKDASDLRSTKQYTFADISNTLKIHDEAFLGERLLLTPYGKEDAIPLCVNVYTAPEKLIEAMIQQLTENHYTIIVKIPVPAKTSTPADGDADYDAFEYEFKFSDLTDKTALKNKVLAAIKDGRNVPESIDLIADRILTAFPDKTDADDLRDHVCAWTIGRSLLGAAPSSGITFDATTKNKNGGDITVTVTANLKDDAVISLAGTYDIDELGRFVGTKSNVTAAPATIVSTVADTTIGPGPYFRVFVRGALVNLAKNELVSTANLEMVVDNSSGSPQTIYQRWYENE